MKTQDLLFCKASRDEANVKNADSREAWEDLTRRHGLQTTPIEKLVGWWFGDFVFHTEFDMVSDMGKIRRAGFTEAVETEATIVAAIERLGESKQLP